METQINTQNTQPPITINKILEIIKKQPIEIEEINDKEEVEKMLLTLELSSRYGCGFVYDYYDHLYLIIGEIDVITLKKEGDECVDRAKLLIIPRTVPTILGLISVDENPEYESYIQLYIFNGEKWLTISIPYIREYQKLFEQYTRIW